MCFSVAIYYDRIKKRAVTSWKCHSPFMSDVGDCLSPSPCSPFILWESGKSLISECYAKVKTYVVVAVYIVGKRFVFIARKVVVDGKMDAATLVRHGIECHACFGLHVEAPAIIVELYNLGVGIHLCVHCTHFHGEVRFPMFAFYYAVFQ